jgi:hypothetical protein
MIRRPTLLLILLLIGISATLTACRRHESVGAYNPAVAYDSLNNRYITAYVKFRSENSNDARIYGAFVDSSGSLQGNEFVVSELGSDDYCPSIAYDTSRGRFLVVWNADGSMFAQVVNADGTRLGAGLHLADTAGWDIHRCSSASYDEEQGNFLALWGEARSPIVGPQPVTAEDLYARFISPDGSFVGSKILVASDARERISPKSAYDTVQRRFLAVWDSDGIRGRFINGDGSLTGSEFTIASGSGAYSLPSAVFDDANSRFLVAWAQSDGGPYYLQGQLLNADGSLYQSAFRISSAGLDMYYHSLAYDQTRHNYFAVMGDYATLSIYGQVITADGALDASVSGENILLSYAGYTDDKRPAVAYDSVNQRYLAAWDYGTSDQVYSDVHMRPLLSDGTPAGDISVLSNGGSW